ncbi:hypothetical protein D6D03_07205 [Aureobasidium pullulans]|nr:hypothetical protein D6D03_07205 [Aureobasidium pullulans]
MSEVKSRSPGVRSADIRQFFKTVKDTNNALSLFSDLHLRQRSILLLYREADWNLHLRSASGTHGPSSRYEPGSPRNPFPGPGCQYRARHEAAVSVHTSPDALLNGALVASAERMHRIREELLTPSRPRQPDFGRGSTSRRRRRDERSLSPFEDLVTPTRRSRAAPASGSARGSRSVRFSETPIENQLAALRRRIEELICASYPSASRIALEEPAAHLPQ